MNPYNEVGLLVLHMQIKFSLNLFNKKVFTLDCKDFCQSILRCFGNTDYVTNTEEETGVEKVRDGHRKVM